MKIAFSFDDVLLVPRMSEIQSRKEVSLSSSIKDLDKIQIEDEVMTLPIISSPMDTVTGKKMVKEMHYAGGLGIAHRYCSIEDQVAFTRGISYPAAAIGVTGDFHERTQELVKSGCKVLCIDVAHGHHIAVKNALEKIKNEFNNDIAIIAGNVATARAFEHLSSWGADAVRVGIGGGSICSTRIQTGHGVPTLQSIIDCANSEGDAKIIADGGIRNAGDIVKSLAAGANFVMLGSLLAGTDQTPGQVFTSSDGSKYKVYRGMASVEAQVDWRGEARSLEGVSTTIPYKGSVTTILKNLEQNIRSGLSYSGARNIAELQANSKFIQQTQAGLRESFTHILNK